MIKKQIANWIIEFDKETTKSTYAAMPLEMSCNCNICRNFSTAISMIPKEVCVFFEELGIEPAKPSEIYENIFENDYVLYGGFYHIVGNYLSGDDIWQPISENSKNQNTTSFFKIIDGFQIGFTRDLALIPKNFPYPVLQMEINFTLPWILDDAYNS